MAAILGSDGSHGCGGKKGGREGLDGVLRTLLARVGEGWVGIYTRKKTGSSPKSAKTP